MAYITEPGTSVMGVQVGDYVLHSNHKRCRVAGVDLNKDTDMHLRLEGLCGTFWAADSKVQRLVEVDYVDRRRGDLITFKAVTAAVKSVPFGDTPDWVERVERPMPLEPFEEPKPDKIVVTLELTKAEMDALASLVGKTAGWLLGDAYDALLDAGGDSTAFDVTPAYQPPTIGPEGVGLGVGVAAIGDGAALKLTRRNS